MTPRPQAPEVPRADADAAARCRACSAAMLRPVLDLGLQPLAGDYPRTDDDAAIEPRWPLRVLLCARCHLVQLAPGAPSEAQLPGTAPWSQSSTMRAHAEAFADRVATLAAGPGRIVELASHGGYLHGFLARRGLSSIIIEASPPLAADLRSSGIAVVDGPLTPDRAAELRALEGSADVLIDNYLVAHLPDPDLSIAGVARLLAPSGRFVLEFDHLLPVVSGRQFDAFRHGHFSYLSLHAVIDLLERHGLTAVGVEEYPVYGGALRVEARHRVPDLLAPDPNVERILEREQAARLDEPATYERFAKDVEDALEQLRQFLAVARTQGRMVVGYGAATRAATLLNAAGVTPEQLPFVADRSPLKQGRLMPGCRIPIVHPSRIEETTPDDILILTWDIADEIATQLEGARARGARLFVPVPKLKEVPRLGRHARSS